MKDDHQPIGMSDSVRLALAQLPRTAQRKLALASVAAASAAALDILGVLLLAVVGAALLTYVGGSDSAPLPSLPFFGELPETGNLVIYLALMAVAILTMKSLIAWRLSLGVYRFLGTQQAAVGRGLFERAMNAPFGVVQHIPTAALSQGIVVGSRAMVQLLGGLVALVAEAALIASLGLLLALNNIVLFAFSIIYFGIVAVTTGALVGRRTHRAASTFSEADKITSVEVYESAGLSRDIRVYGLVGEYSGALERNLSTSARAGADLAVWTQVPRYVLEAALVLGLVLATGLVVWTQPPESAAFSLGLFLLAASRLIPSIQRANGAWGQMQVARGQMRLVKPIIDLPEPQGGPAGAQKSDLVEQAGQSSPIRLSEVSVRYPSGQREALSAVSLTIQQGSRVALVGPSGAGKSTLAEVLLGLVPPTSGSVSMPITADGTRLSVALVPQEVFISSQSVRRNVTLALDDDRESDDAVWRALEMAQLDRVVRNLPEGIETGLGERGSRLSGGERQRLGLARALFRRPELLVLDEATSALDAQTESAIVAALDQLDSSVTVVTVAHRLSTIANSDRVFLLEEGKLIASGAPTELYESVAAFRRAARLQGTSFHRGSGVNSDGTRLLEDS